MAATTPYDADFYEAIRDAAVNSAAVVAKELAGVLRLASGGAQPSLMLSDAAYSIVDVGGGEGHWAAAFRDQAPGQVAAALCVDGPGVDRHVVPFLERDLTQPLDLYPDDPKRVDLVICLEVAEHLPPERAASFVADLCRLSNIVLFSAAVPGQPGTGHINCQPPTYWRDLFAANGLAGSGALRHLFWGDDRVEWWYQQNLLLFAPAATLTDVIEELGLPDDIDPCNYIVHPVLYEWALNQ